MRRTAIILSLLFVVSVCNAQFFGSKAVNVFNPYSNAESNILGVNTTLANEQVIWFWGDSNMDGRGESIPTVASSTLYLWNGSSNTEITTQSLSNDDNTKGGLQQQFATDYKALSGYKTIAVQNGSGGSAMADWDGSGGGDLYPAAKSAVNAALAFNGLTKPKYIVINLGLNSVGGGITNITNSMITILSNLNTDFSGVPIIWIQTGRGSATVSQSTYDIRNLLKTKAEENTLLNLVGIPAAFIGAGWMQGDNLHFTQAGYNALGSMLVRWIGNKAYTNKWSRSLISSHFDVLSASRAALVDYVITRLYNRGDFFKLESLHLFKNTTQNNIYIDWSYLGFVSGSPSSFTANSHTSGNGSSTNLTWSFIGLYCRSASMTNYRTMIYLKDRLTADGSAAAIYGVNDGTSQMDLRQTGSAVTYKAIDATASNGTETSLTDANWYGNGRDGGTKYIYKNKTVDASASVSGVSFVAGVAPRIFAYNNNGSIANHFSGQIEAIIAAPNTNFDWDSLIDDIDYLRANW